MPARGLVLDDLPPPPPRTTPWVMRLRLFSLPPLVEAEEGSAGKGDGEGDGEGLVGSEKGVCLLILLLLLLLILLLLLLLSLDAVVVPKGAGVRGDCFFCLLPLPLPLFFRRGVPSSSFCF